MALCWIEGFEAHRISTQFARKYASTTGYAATMSTTGRVHGTAGTFQVGTLVTPTISAFDNTFVMGFGLLLTTHSTGINTSNYGFYVERSGAEQCHIEFESTDPSGIRMQLYRDTTLIATSGYMPYNTWAYCEVKLTVRDGTDGAYEFRINGVTSGSGSSVNLANTASDGWSEWAIRSNANLTTLHIDDIYVCDGSGSSNNDFKGDRVVEAVEVTGAGASTTWDPVSGANYECVDDAANVAADDAGAGGYVSTDTNDETDLYEFGDLSVIVGGVDGIQVTVQAAMAAAGSRNLIHRVREPDGPTVVDGATFSVASTTYAGFNTIYQTNPALAAAWDIDGVNDIQFGFRTET